jgi:hypothetical protein
LRRYYPRITTKEELSKPWYDAPSKTGVTVVFVDIESWSTILEWDAELGAGCAASSAALYGKTVSQ